MAKAFSQKLHDENKFVEQVTCDLLVNHTGFVLRTPLNQQTEQYKKCDYEGYYNLKKVRVEAERKLVWTIKGKWMPQWDTIDVPYRKCESEADLFIMANKDCNTFAIIPMKDILESPVIVKNTTYTKSEKFFAVPIKKWIIVSP